MKNEYIFVKKMQAAVISIVILSSVYSQKLKYPENELILENTITQDGYPVETYPITTEDGYILTVYHIPHGLENRETNAKNRSSVLLLPGLVGTGRHYLVLGKHRAAGYYFADKGLDVWLFSRRGSKGSFRQKHTKYDWNKDPQFWHFSLEEIGAYDIPATIDFILNHTGQQTLSMIGHSSGSYEFMAMLAEKPRYNDKVKVAINWGAAPLMRHLDYPLLEFLTLFVDLFKGVWKYFGFVEVIPYFDEIQSDIIEICSVPAREKLCLLVGGIIGSHRAPYDLGDLREMLISMTRVSSRLGFNFADNIRNNNFGRYDHGPKKNVQIYGQIHPPAFNLSAVTAPLAFFVGPNDGIITKKSVSDSASQLSNVILIYDIPHPGFNHLDFIGAQNATELVYEPTYRLINDIDNGIVYSPIKVPSVF